MDRKPQEQLRGRCQANLLPELKPGDHVRVTSLSRVNRYHVGDTGIVRMGPQISPISGVTFYAVSMARDCHAWNVFFKADEIESRTFG